MRHLYATALSLVLIAACQSSAGPSGPASSVPAPAAQAATRPPVAGQASAMQPAVPATSEIADLERKVEETRDRMAPGKATDLELLQAQIALNEARLRHAVVTGRRQQALQALDALVQVQGQKVQVVQERLQVGKAAGRDLPEAALALYEARLRLAIMRNQAKEALAAADDAVRTQQQNADALRELLQVGKVPQEELTTATGRLEEWRALQRQQALVVKAQGRLDQLASPSGGQADPKAVEGAKADLATARKQVYILASLLMPAASDLLAGAAAGGAPLADQPADDAPASAATRPQTRPVASQPVARGTAASEPAARSAAARAPDRSQYEVPHPAADAKANLVIRDFPARFADYNSMQGMPGPVILDPKPAFCKSDKPLFCDLTKDSVLPVKIILDQSAGPGGTYDTLYMDFNGNGDFLDDPVYKASPFDDAGASMASYVRGYFRDVHIVRNRANKVTAHVQVMIMAGPSWPADPKACYLLFMAQKWAVGTVKLNGKDVPAALIDRTWNDSFIDARGLNPAEHPNVFPRSDYLVLAIDGEDKLISTGRLLNEGGTAYALLAKYLQLNKGLYEVRAEQSAEGVRLELLPAAPLPMGELEFSDVYRRPDPLMMIGTSTCVLLKKPGQTIRVPADTYYVPASMNMPGGDALVTVDAEEEATEQSGQGSETTTQPAQQSVSATRAPAAPEADALHVAESQAAEAGETLTGVVRGPDGEPLADVQVILCPKNKSVFLFNDESQNKGHTVIASGEGGALAVPVDEQVGALLASHERGVATVSMAEFARSRTIRLQPWASVEGVVRVGRDVAPSADVRLHCQMIGMNVAWVSIDYEMKADEQGRFRFEHVPPGLVQIGRMIDLYRTETSWFPGHCPGYFVDVPPGRTTQVQLGGTGRPISGHATLAGWKEGRFGWGKSFVSLAVKQEMPSPPPGLDRHGQYEWRQNWLQSDAGRQYQLGNRWYNVPIGRDGHFRIEDVPAGTYTLSVEAYHPNGEWRNPKTKVTALQRDVAVPAMETGWSDEPLNLGTLELAAESSGLQADRAVATKPAAAEQSGQGGSAGAGAATQPTALASPQAKPVAAASQASAGPARKALPTDVDSLLGGRKPYKVPASQPGQRCNLVWQDFPPGFGDYFCVQGTGAPAVPDPRPGFCKSDRPLLFHTPKGAISSALLFDQSMPDAPYDTLYVDLNDNGDFLDDPVYRARPYEGIGPDLEKVHSRFVNVQVVRNRDQQLRAHVQVYLEEVLFNATNQPPFSVSLVPQRWAVGTVRLKGRDVPAAVFDRTWNDKAVEQAGLNLHEYKDRYPRGDYLILEPAGGEDLRPGPPMPSTGGRSAGSPRTILNEYLQIGDDTYKVSAAQFEDGVQLALSPVQLPMGKVRVQITARASRVIGLKTSVLLPKPPEEGDVIAVPADTYVLLDYDAGLDAPAVVEPGQTADLPKLPFRLRPEPAGKPVVGDLAPDFQTTTLEGKPLKLADYRGRLVLLGFWAAWCGPCVTEIPDLRALHERFGRDSRFAMVSLSLDEDTDMVEAFRQKTPMPWTQCFLGEKERAATTRKYGVNSLPATFLIGPDGRILAINLRGPQIAEAVEKALAASNAAAASPSR